jgi:hypothetical protein
MRARRVGALLCAMGLLAACAQEEPTRPVSNPADYPPELAKVVVPAATAQPTQLTLVAPVEAYSIAWKSALSALREFHPAVGVAALAEGDTSGVFCGEAPPPGFNVDGTAILYCRTAHEGPDPLPYAGIILVPNSTYEGVLNTGDPEADQAARSQGTALLLAAGYARHVIVELKASGLLSRSQADQLTAQGNCLTGLTIRSYIPAPIDDSKWGKTLAFLSNFTVEDMPYWNPDQIMRGFKSGHLRTCLS